MRTLQTCISLFLYFFICLFFVGGVQAASLKFDKSTVTVTVGSTFTLDAQIDAGSDQITSTDMWILYDPALLEAQSASSGAFFPAVTNTINSGKVYIAGLVTDPGTYKTGSGTVATISFKGLQNGTATISYDCRADVSNSSKVIKNSVDPTNVIVCSSNGTSVVTIGSGGSVAPTSAIPTGVYTNPVNPTSLPQTGLMDEFPKLMTLGILFVAVGSILRLFLL